MAKFNLLAKDIIDLDLKLDGKLPVNRDELFALVNSWGRNNWFYTYDKNDNEVLIDYCKPNEKYDLSKLDVSLIEDFNKIFLYSYFNNDISLWNTSNATSMISMFYETNYFNCNINSWDVSKVTNMGCMFYKAKDFNQPLDNWNTSKVTDMDFMFYGAEKFNQNINSWNISNVTNIDHIFSNTKKFNQPLDKWDVSKVTNMEYMFAFTKAFNQAILWDLSHVEYCNEMFCETEAFEKRFNNDEELPNETNRIKKWLKENRNKMIAFDIEDNKGKELDKFLLNFDIITSTKLNGLHDVITSTKLNGLHNNMEIDNVNI